MAQRSKTYNRKKLLEIFIGIVVTAVALYFCTVALKGLDPICFLQSDINWWLAAVSAVIFAFSTYIRGLVYPYGIDKNMTVMEAWQIVAIGNASNMILPFHAGEGVRLTVFPREYGAAERVRLAIIPGFVDIGIILLLSIAAVYIADFKQSHYLLILKIVTYSYLAVCALIITVLLLIPQTHDKVMSYFNADTLQMIKWDALSWLTMLFSIWVGFLSLGYGPIRSIILTTGAFAGMNIVGLIPASPGNIGIFEWSVVEGLAGLGISEMPAKIAGVLLHLIQYAALLPLGFVLYLRFLLQRRKDRKYIFARRTTRRAFFRR
jgi:uncharacterized membrane protein YbhN (UPF0104 family)